MHRTKLPEVFHIKRNEELLAVLESCVPSGEMFWLACDFKPTAAFAEVEQIFREADESDDMNIFEQNYDKLEKMGVVLVDTEQDIIIKYFFMHIKGNIVHVRWVDPPYDE